MNRPEIIAHRGASRERPENTVAAFHRAVTLGADGLELDVHLSSDGVLFVHHDATPVHALTSALTGAPIRSLTAEQLRTFRVRGEPIPTLSDVLEATGTSAMVYCELKGALTAKPTCHLLGEGRWRTAVHSFDHRQVAEARRLGPALARGVLESSYHLDPVGSLASVDARDLWQYWELIDEALVTAVHERGGRVVARTVNDASAMQALGRLGVDALCTDDVALAIRTLGLT